MPEPRPQTVRADAVFNKRDKLLASCGEYFGLDLAGVNLDAVAVILAKDLSSTPEAVKESIRPHAGRTFSRDLAFELCWKLAGNAAHLKAGEPVPVWTPDGEPLWVPVEITDVDYLRGDRPAARLHLRVIAGPACPREERYILSTKYCKYVAGELGFSKPWGNCPYKHPRQLTRLRTYILSDPTKSKPSAIAFSKFKCSSGFRNWNKKFITRRSRVNFRCPRGYNHPCHACPIGYTDCPIACHSVTYQTETDDKTSEKEPSRRATSIERIAAGL